MLVKAKRVGYYDDRRIKVGEVFELHEVELKEPLTEYDDEGKPKKKKKTKLTEEEQFSEKWVQKVDEEGKALDGSDEPEEEEEAEDGVPVAKAPSAKKTKAPGPQQDKDGQHPRLPGEGRHSEGKGGGGSVI